MNPSSISRRHWIGAGLATCGYLAAAHCQALAAGLQEKLFQPGSEKSNGFYAELPIRIKLVGTYHDFGNFVSGIAALPRIVTLHDIQITPVDTKGGYDNLTMDVTAKTYRYIEDEGGGRPAKKKAGGAT